MRIKRSGFHFECDESLKECLDAIERLHEFVEDVRDNYDCETGANGVHAHRCRRCVAGDVLGKPPELGVDPRTRGG